MAFGATINGPRNYGIKHNGFSFDIRPGKNPSDWIFDHTYAWPVPHGPRPVTLIPALIDPEWETQQQDTGPFARYKMNQFILASGQVKEYTRLHSKDHIIWTKRDPVIATKITSRTPLGLNHGLSIHFAASGSQLTNKKVLEIQFGHTNPKKALRLNVFENGRGYLSRGNAAVTAPKDQLAEGSLVPNRWGSILNRWVRLFIFPHGRNRLLITSSTGDGFIWEDTNIPRTPPLYYTTFPPNIRVDQYSPAIKPAPYHITAYNSTAMQPRPIAYHGLIEANGYSGTITPKNPDLLSVASIPINTSLLTHHHDVEMFEHIQADPYYAYNFPVHQINPQLAALTPTLKLIRPKKTDQDVHKTPQLYRHGVRHPAERKVKINEATDIKDDIITLTHSHSKDAATGNVEIRYAENHPTYHRKFNIPFDVTEDGNQYFQGYLISPKIKTTGPDANFLSFELQDEMKFLNNAMVLDLERLDGLAVEEAIKSILVGVGFPSDGSMWEIDPMPITDKGKKIWVISKGEADSDPTNASDVLRSVGDWIKYLIDTYTSSAFYPFQWVAGFAPYFHVSNNRFEYKFFLRDPEILSASPSVKTWFPTYALAEDPPDDSPPSLYTESYRSVYLEFEEEILEPEGNALLMVGVSQEINTEAGQDEDTGEEKDGKALKAYIENPSSIDSELPLEEWDSDHIGWKQQIVIIDGSLNTQGKVNEATVRIAGRLFHSRAKATLKAEWEPQIKMYDKVTVWRPLVPLPDPDHPANMANYDIKDWSVIGFDVNHIQDGNHTGVFRTRPATYTLERWLT